MNKFQADKARTIAEGRSELEVEPELFYHMMGKSYQPLFFTDANIFVILKGKTDAVRRLLGKTTEHVFTDKDQRIAALEKALNEDAKDAKIRELEERLANKKAQEK